MVPVSRCARPGCHGTVAAWLTYDYASRQVWLDDHRADAGDRWPLCSGHAGRLKAPQGWQQLDRRTRPAPEATSTAGALAS